MLMKHLSVNQYPKKSLKNIKHFLMIIGKMLTFGMIITGCVTVGPDYVPVQPDVPEKWHAEMDGGIVADPTTIQSPADWWSIFNDAELSFLMKEAVAGNPDLQTARSRILEARALREINRASLFPLVDASASATKQRTYRSGDKREEVDIYTAGFDAGWELDVFGGAKRSIEASQADLEATQENLYHVLISLLAETALNHIEIRTYQARLKVLTGSVKTLEETYHLNRSRLQAGIIGELALQESLRSLESSRAAIPVLESGLASAKNRLAVLLGKPPGELYPELSDTKPIPGIPKTVTIGIPADTLRNRPDVRRAERLLAAQTARIGVATADLYPKFRLFGSIGLESVDSSDFFDWDSRFWGFGPGVSWRIFDAGAIRRNIEVQTIRQEQALIDYQATILDALEEVENALVAYAKEQQRENSLSKAVMAAQRAELLALDRYKAGLEGFFNVLDTQRSLLVLQDELEQSKGLVVGNLVRLYKALGGGWEYETMMEPSSSIQ